MTRPSSTADNFPGDAKDLNWEAIGKSGSRDAMIEKWDGDPDTRPLDALDPLELAGATVPVQKPWADPTKAKVHKAKGADGVVPTPKKKGS